MLVLFGILHYVRKKEDNYREITARHARTQDRIQREIRDRQMQGWYESNHRQAVRDTVDGWREERNLRPIYGPNGIRTEMRQEAVPASVARLRINHRPPIDPDNRPKEGDVREDCIIANQPEHGVRVYQFHNGRWHLKSTVKPIDFLTEDDVVIT